MTIGDGLNKRAPGQSELSEVVVEVLESIVKSGFTFQFAESHFGTVQR